MKKPTIAITLGDPLGIGSEIVQKALADKKIAKLANWKMFGTSYSPDLTPVQAGKKSYLALEEAIWEINAGRCDGLVTAPVSKTHLKKAGFKYPGHTEYLAHIFKAKNMGMMLFSPQLKVVLVTIHIPLSQVFKELSKKKIHEKIILTHQSLINDFGIKKPRIGVLGLNPHAGENGMMGQEEKTLIGPAIAQARRKGLHVTGPLPPDTAFHLALEGQFDAMVCHYHDQGLIPLKTLSFHEGVNTTLGLPIVRTSPDHGCAFDIAGQNKANPTSMKAAMAACVEMIRHRAHPI